MGACCSTLDTAVELRTSTSIDTRLSEEEHYEKKNIKLLFLGPGGSGKSTIFRQLQWLHGGGMTNKDRLDFKAYITKQIIQEMHLAIQYYLSDVAEDDELQNAINRVKAIKYNQKVTKQLADDITNIWKNDNRMKGVFHRFDATKVLQESTQYFWDSMHRISDDKYIPNKTDIINVRNMTTGIIDKKFTVKKCNFHIFDVGGQKCERKKWFRCFDGVRALVFVVALSSYNELMFEDDQTNAMDDALELFDRTIHHDMFENTPVILFLNKKDLFKIKVKVIPITVCPSFEADFEIKMSRLGSDIKPNDYIQTSYYVKHKFRDVNKVFTRKLYVHSTCAMDDKNIGNVFEDIVDIMLKDIINNAKQLLW